jgi:predicted aminopeptidase
MDMIRQAQYRIDQREQERRFKEKRAAEYRAALEELDRQEHKANWPDNPKRVEQVAQIRTLKREIGQMQDEEYGMSEQLAEIGEG